jgi:hypothetical protein
LDDYSLMERKVRAPKNIVPSNRWGLKGHRKCSRK